jgi:hypothetical protein
MRRERVHREMDALERRIETAASESDLLKIDEERKQIMKKVGDMALPEAERFDLKHHNRLVKDHLQEMKSLLAKNRIGEEPGNE